MVLASKNESASTSCNKISYRALHQFRIPSNYVRYYHSDDTCDVMEVCTCCGEISTDGELIHDWGGWKTGSG